MKPTKSPLTVDYALRPAKQVERRMLFDAFQLLADAGFQIRDYQYTGFGELAFVDFILFHKLLGINRMWSVEYLKDIEKRLKFNKPFDCIQLFMSEIGNVIPLLPQNQRHILWLDYDLKLTRDRLEEIGLAAACLPNESILLITIDVEAPDVPPPGGPEKWRSYFFEEAGDYLNPSFKPSEFAKSKLPRINASIIDGAINRGLVGRDESFIPLFNFVYSDGHRMISLGGMIGNQEQQERVLASNITKSIYYRASLTENAYKIRVPRLTRKERMYLDQRMPTRGNRKPQKFELSDEDFQAFKEIYRFVPNFAEVFL